MSSKGLIAATTALAFVATAGSASAAYQNNMFNTPLDPSSYGTLLASMDANDPASVTAAGHLTNGAPTGPWEWPFDANNFTTSGYRDSFDNNGTEVIVDETQLISEVYQVNSPQSFSDGGDQIDLLPGDRVYAYRLRLVHDSANTLNSMFEFQAIGAALAGTNESLATSLIIGRGVFLSDFYGGATPAAGNIPDALAGDFETFGGGAFGGKMDFQWTGPDSDQLQNNEEITLLLFARGPQQVGYGNATFVGDPGQVTGVDPNANGAPILIPVIPSPGALALAGVAMVAGIRRRR